MPRVDIKPLSINEAWQGRRFKTPKYTKYRDDMYLILPRLSIPEEGDLYLDIDLGLSNASFDIDNALKPFIDCLQDKYGFNDKRITRLLVTKTIVSKGQEYIEFELDELK